MQHSKKLLGKYIFCYALFTIIDNNNHNNISLLTNEPLMDIQYCFPMVLNNYHAENQSNQLDGS